MTIPTRRMLDGVTVLDLGRVAAAPHAALLLGSLGARVIKVERPVHGDDTRANPFLFENGESAYFLQQNAGKESISLDLKHPSGLEALKKLIRVADVVVENFRPGTMEGLGVSWEEIQKINPRAILCSISAYGQNGPDALKPGYGALAEARAGMPQLVGEPDGPPMPSPIAMPDFSAAAHAFGAICAALYARERTGHGERIDIALLDCAVEMHDWAVQLHTASGGEVAYRRRGRFDRSIVPWGYFETSDGWVAMIVSNDRFWRKLAELIGRPELGDDPRFATVSARSENADEVYELLTSWVRSHGSQELLDEFAAADIPAERVAEIADLPRDPQLMARNMFIEIEHPELGTLKVLNTPLTVPTSGAGIRGLAPKLGEHNEAILSELGYSGHEIAALYASHALYQPQQEQEGAR